MSGSEADQGGYSQRDRLRGSASKAFSIH